MNLFHSWPELLSLILILLGGLLAINTQALWLSLFTVFIAGCLFAHLWWLHKKTASWPLILMSFSFLLGYMLGTDFDRLKLSIFFYIIGYISMLVSHQKGYL
ncbi:MAG: hypothetical protein AABX52_04670 [Nanoarchaeota archaeon]